ncbi:alpha-N-arabinofuranosidase [Paractinoplanes deccanensis]|uniref:non-reducing end alpha-L-arabinofuranosidase n=1 Tax=Paractinoplanes deccanensis TaxID=113561 RepID=A0ABQ3YK50_9ACTN|nr:alpha-N-arabinofuranosidase [Actinoplanes deccanensis]GID80386.1 alpha-N-arabinofuranosidase [Actinoplanes deccanensis]
MRSASLIVDPAFRIGAVDPRLYGSFVEHLGRCVYQGIFEPGHPSADENGFRRDVAELVRGLGVPIIRYPGGNFVSAYNWEDGIGPVHDRPARIDLAWRSIETNRVGLDEFQRWAATVNAETMMAVNLGTRGIDEARALVEYCNHPSGTAWSDRRRANGAAEPYGIKVWCLGNEMDGPWQIGHKTALEYGRLAAEAGKAMRLVDPGVELVISGSSHSRMPTFGTWERIALTEAYDTVDHISMHSYYQQHGDDRDSFLAAAVDMDRFIDAIVATADHVRAVGRHTKRLTIAFDEWNVWYQSRFPGEKNLPIAEAPPLLEDVYSVTDAVVAGNLLISLLRHADRVRIGCQAQLVNVIAPIMTAPGGPAWRQTIYHPYALTSRYGRGTVLRVEARSPAHETSAYGEVALLDAVAVLRDDGGLVVFAVNRDQGEEMAVDIDLRSLPRLVAGEHITVADADPDAVNDQHNPERVTPRRLGDAKVDGGRLTVVLPPLSWNMVRLTL